MLVLGSDLEVKRRFQASSFLYALSTSNFSKPCIGLRIGGELLNGFDCVINLILHLPQLLDVKQSQNFEGLRQTRTLLVNSISNAHGMFIQIDALSLRWQTASSKPLRNTLHSLFSSLRLQLNGLRYVLITPASFSLHTYTNVFVSHCSWLLTCFWSPFWDDTFRPTIRFIIKQHACRVSFGSGCSCTCSVWANLEIWALTAGFETVRGGKETLFYFPIIIPQSHSNRWRLTINPQILQRVVLGIFFPGSFHVLHLKGVERLVDEANISITIGTRKLSFPHFSEPHYLLGNIPSGLLYQAATLSG